MAKTYKRRGTGKRRTRRTRRRKGAGNWWPFAKSSPRKKLAKYEKFLKKNPLRALSPSPGGTDWIADRLAQNEQQLLGRMRRASGLGKRSRRRRRSKSRRRRRSKSRRRRRSKSRRRRRSKSRRRRRSRSRRRR